MATNTNSNVFRTLDVDKYSEDTYKEDLDIAEVAAPVSENGDQESVLESLLAAGKASEALSHVLAMKVRSHCPTACTALHSTLTTLIQ